MLVLTSEQAPRRTCNSSQRERDLACYRNLRPAARVSAVLPLALVEQIDHARGNVSRGRYLQMVINAPMTREQPASEDGQN